MKQDPDHPKVSFLIERESLQQVQAFATSQDLKLSEGLRVVIQCGLMAIKKAGLAGEDLPLPLGYGATRGRFPAPERSSEDGRPS